MDARWAEYLPTLSAQRSAEKSAEVFAETITAMNRAGREAYYEFYADAYAAQKGTNGYCVGLAEERSRLYRSYAAQSGRDVFKRSDSRNGGSVVPVAYA